MGIPVAYHVCGMRCALKPHTWSHTHAIRGWLGKMAMKGACTASARLHICSLQLPREAFPGRPWMAHVLLSLGCACTLHSWPCRLQRVHAQPPCAEHMGSGHDDVTALLGVMTSFCHGHSTPSIHPWGSPILCSRAAVRSSGAVIESPLGKGTFTSLPQVKPIWSQWMRKKMINLRQGIFHRINNLCIGYQTLLIEVSGNDVICFTQKEIPCVCSIKNRL